MLDWFLERATRLEDTLRDADPEERVATWWPPDQTAGFWIRRMAHETAIHHWDVENAVGSPRSIEPVALAQDGLDETLTVILPSEREHSDAPAQGESYHFHQTDGNGEWTVRFASEGVQITRGHERADVAVRGPASELQLFLLGRIPADRLDVHGDRAILDRYFQLVPSF